MCKSFDIFLNLIRVNRINQIHPYQWYMAKVKIKIGENEIEIESRDFYIDNQSISDVIEILSQHVIENKARISSENVESTIKSSNSTSNYDPNCLNFLEEAEVHEPEFSEPVPIAIGELRGKLEILSKNSFFNSSKTVSETVNQLREYGWSVSSLDVSKTLNKMASNREILKSSQKNGSYYSIQETILIN